ncbi:uncharacterized protein Dyak_GE27977 [Drosophila yakuba]|uniref:Uncharacterized protein n=1 Tax=Drosophila yakuba TaxID=7245 RepID=A0A0R1DJ18_DROYA|nr:uncharacterized protein Dyak_GE27977 [Drosophila yakuba]
MEEDWGLGTGDMAVCLDGILWIADAMKLAALRFTSLWMAGHLTPAAAASPGYPH